MNSLPGPKEFLGKCPDPGMRLLQFCSKRARLSQTFNGDWEPFLHGTSKVCNHEGAFGQWKLMISFLKVPQTS